MVRYRSCSLPFDQQQKSFLNREEFSKVIFFSLKFSIKIFKKKPKIIYQKMTVFDDGPREWWMTWFIFSRMWIACYCKHHHSVTYEKGIIFTHSAVPDWIKVMNFDIIRYTFSECIRYVASREMVKNHWFRGHVQTTCTNGGEGGCSYDHNT